jgi:hypothetical protein
MTDFALVSLTKAKTHLRVSGSAQDADIQDKIYQASSIILDYLKLDEPPIAWYDHTTTGLEPPDEMPRLVEAATLLVLSELHSKRETASDPLSKSVKDLLRRLRDPALA